MTRKEEIQRWEQLKQELLVYKETLENPFMAQAYMAQAGGMVSVQGNTLQKEDEKVKKLVRWKKNPFGN